MGKFKFVDDQGNLVDTLSGTGPKVIKIVPNPENDTSGENQGKVLITANGKTMEIPVIQYSGSSVISNKRYFFGFGKKYQGELETNKRVTEGGVYYIQSYSMDVEDGKLLPETVTKLKVSIKNNELAGTGVQVLSSIGDGPSSTDDVRYAYILYIQLPNHSGGLISRTITLSQDSMAPDIQITFTF